MKAPVILGSLLALAGTATTAESANAAVSNVDIQEDLNQAVCAKDWYRAIEVSSKLIASSTITPDYRQTLLDWRRQFYAHTQKTAAAAPNCTEFRAALGVAQSPAGPEPRFSGSRSSRSVGTTGEPSSAQRDLLTNIWAVGVRVEGNSIKGTVLNNGLTTANNVTLTIRSQQADRSENVRTVAIDTVQAWDETDFVAAFSDTPGSWMIESIQVN
ncbi:MAG: hypothetical protein ACFB2W_27125 [Leptolyngbyaceae cyanobacterium]